MFCRKGDVKSYKQPVYPILTSAVNGADSFTLRSFINWKGDWSEGGSILDKMTKNKIPTPT